MGRGLVDRAQEATGPCLDQAHRCASGGSDVGQIAGASSVGPEPPPGPPAEQSRIGKGVDRGSCARAEQLQVVLGQGELRGRGAQVRTEYVGILGCLLYTSDAADDLLC